MTRRVVAERESQQPLPARKPLAVQTNPINAKETTMKCAACMSQFCDHGAQRRTRDICQGGGGGIWLEANE